MSDSTPSAGVKALTYAEEHLGVHKVYSDAVTVRQQLDDIFTAISTERDKKREVEFRLQDLELEIVAEERSKHADLSQAALDRHIKVVLHNHTDVREWREELMKITSDIEGLEYDARIAETDVRIAVARLQELGGYLNYLAAVKQAEIAREAKVALGIT